MAADILTTLATWSTTEGSNLPIGSTAISTNLDDNLRMIQSVVRYTMASDTIASATTTDLGTKESQYLTVSGVTTITGLGTISAGITKYVTFSGALILTHNATSLILPGAANITTAAGDTGRFISLGSGNWKCLAFNLASGRAVVSSPQMSDGTVSLPGMPFASDLDSGIYRIGANNWGLVAGGTKIVDIATTGAAVTGTLSNTGAATFGPSGMFAINAAGALTVTGASVQNITFTTASAAFLIAGTSSTGGAIGLAAGVGQGAELAGGSITGAGTAGAVTIRGGITQTGVAGPVQITAGHSSTSQVGSSIQLNLPGSTTPGSVNVVSTSAFYQIDGASKHVHVYDSSNTPTITSGGGTTPSIAGSDNAFRIVVGTGGSASTVTVTFNKAWTNAPMAFANHQGALLPLRCVTTTTTVVIDAASAFTASGSIDCFCIGRI